MSLESRPLHGRSGRLGLLVALLSLAAAAPALAQPSDPRQTELYKQVQVSNPEQLFIPPQILRHVVQLPTPWQDPLAAGQVTPAGEVAEVRASGGGVIAETQTFRLEIASEGAWLHLRAIRKTASPQPLFPSLTLREPAKPVALAVAADKEGWRVYEAKSGRTTLHIARADATVRVPSPVAAHRAEDRLQFSYSNLDRRVYLRWPLGEDHVYGLGMKGGSLDRRGRRFTMWNTDAYGYDESRDPLYASIPFFMLSRGDGAGARGMFVDDASDLVTDFGFTWPGTGVVSTAEGALDLYYFAAGPSLADVLDRYQRLTGVFALPPIWALGYQQSAHTYYPEERLLQIARTFREKKIPCDALYLDIIHQDRYRPFTWNRTHFPKPRELIRTLHGMGYRVLTIVDPGIGLDDDYAVFREGRARGCFLKTEDGRLYANNVWPGYSAFPDFLRGECRDWWAAQHKTYLDDGVDAFKNDMSEPATFNKAWAMLRFDEKTPMPSGLAEGTLDENVVSRSAELGAIPHRYFHNAYGLYESLATWKAQESHDERRPFVLMRNSFASGQKTSSIWTGDVAADWPSLRNTVNLILSLNLSGFPISGADNGGFGGRTTPELLVRWTQFSAFSPFFRTHYFYVEQALAKEPWSHGPEVEAILTRYIRLRYRLLPYLYTAVARARDERAPLVQPLFFRHEDDAGAHAAGHQYYWGGDFLVAPVTEAGAGGRFVYLPKGRWFDFWTDALVESRGESRYVKAPLDSIPVFVRAQAIVPTMEPGENTSAFPPREVVLDVYGPGPTMRGELYLDDGKTRGYLEGKSARLVLDLAVRGGEAELKVSRAGDASFAPERWRVRLHGVTGVRTLRFEGRTRPLELRDGRLEAVVGRE